MEQMKPLQRPKFWRPLFAFWAVLLGISSMVLWNWYVLDTREQRESQQRFLLDAEALGQQVKARMQAYEMVLRGLSSAFAGSDLRSKVSYEQWNEIITQLDVQGLYPGISSLVWSRHLKAAELDEWLLRTRIDGRLDFRIFPPGQRDEYQIIKFIGPENERTRRVVGLDLFTQEPQNQTVRKAIDSAQATLSAPRADLYQLSADDTPHIGILMYLPVYLRGQPPVLLGERRASVLGMTNAAFRGQELVEGIFGVQLLSLFHIKGTDVEAQQMLFDSQQGQPVDTPAGFAPHFHTEVDLPLYGRTWRLSISSKPQYEQALLSNSQNLILWMGLSTGLLVALLAAGFVAQRDQQFYAQQQVAQKLHQQAEQLMLANRYKSEFLANMSHELRTPLNSILILSDQLRQNAQGNLSEKQTRHADILYRAGSDLLGLINDVLDLAKIEAGRMQVTLEPLNIQDVLVDMDAAMRPLAEAKGLHLSLSSESSVPQRVHTDRVRLHQILRNLLSNAIKFTDGGQVCLSISAGETLADGRHLLQFAVRDSGIGIDPAQHERVFQAFAQIDGSTRRRFGGTGLGLAITRQLAQALGGEITLHSALGQGSTFTAVLPMQSAPPLAAKAPLAVTRSGQGAPLLIVEDDSEFAAIIMEQASAQGFSSVHCASGVQALALLETEAFAAVVLDILLPDLSGWQVLRRLRALPAHQRTPVHIISCLPEYGALAQDKKAHYLTKPVDSQTLSELFAGLKDLPAQGQALLLVEDIESEREHYQKQLAAQGFSVTSAQSAEQACALWTAQEFAVLVIDMNLPDADGFALLARLDALRPLQGVRLVVNTGLDLSQQGLQQLRGYSAVIVQKRGADTSELAQAVQGFLGQIKQSAAVDNASAPTAASASTSLQGRRLLLVDDDVRNVYAMSALLDDLGVAISTAGNGEQAIACYQNEPLDLILMDMSMPVMDGYTATNLLKTEHGCQIPIIALTAHAMKGDREKCLAAGADDYLAKPVKREELQAMLQHWLQPAQPAQGETH